MDGQGRLFSWERKETCVMNVRREPRRSAKQLGEIQRSRKKGSFIPDPAAQIILDLDPPPQIFYVRFSILDQSSSWSQSLHSKSSIPDHPSRINYPSRINCPSQINDPSEIKHPYLTVHLSWQSRISNTPSQIIHLRSFLSHSDQSSSWILHLRACILDPPSQSTHSR